MIVVQFTNTSYTSQEAALIQTFHPGGLILYGYSMGTAQQVKGLLAAAQHDSHIPLLTFTSVEGGAVDRLAQYLGPRMSAPAMAASGDPAVAQREGAMAAKDLLSFGFNADLAPDVDVALVNGPEQFERTFGNAPDVVTKYSSAWIEGLQSGGVIGVPHSFPGLGSATADVHIGLPVINRSRAELEAVEFAPFRALISSGQLDMIMSTAALFPAIDPNYPAVLSSATIKEILRRQLRFQGVAITDELSLSGISNQWSFSQAAVLAIEAGNDMVTAAWSISLVQGIEDGLKRALATGELTIDQINDAVRRILTLKIRHHLLPGE
jgi:beta-N-acetylhexosaminidase